MIDNASGGEVLTEPELAAYLSVERETLRKMRYRGEAPAHFRVGCGPNGSVRYRAAGIKEWIEEREARASTEAA